MADAIPEFLRRAAEKCGFQRESYNESRMPTLESNICVLPFFGDFRSLFILSTLVFPMYRNVVKGSKYFIVCSWPGTNEVWSGADEVWTIKDRSILRQYAASSVGFSNDENATLNFWRPLNRHFNDTVDSPEMAKYCNFGLSDKYMGDFKSIRRSLPVVKSSGVLGLDFNRALANRPGYKVCIFPNTRAKLLKNGRVVNTVISVDFWTKMVDGLVSSGYTPIVIQNYWTHELPDNEKCLYVRDHDLGKILAAMRVSDCVVDVFGDVSRLAIMARCPYIACTDRAKYMQMKDFELDDLCCPKDLPKKYLFLFPQVLETEHYWDAAILEPVLAKIAAFVPHIERDKLPPGSLIDEEVSYKTVRARKVRKLGVKFIKVEKLL